MQWSCNTCCDQVVYAGGGYFETCVIGFQIPSFFIHTCPIVSTQILADMYCWPKLVFRQVVWVAFIWGAHVPNNASIL